MEPLEYLETAKKAALAAGTLLAEKLGKVTFKEKSPADLVSEADVASQGIIEEIIWDSFPDHAFLGEESPKGNRSHNKKGRLLSESECGSGAPADLPFTWIVDPLDGTTNYVHQVPHFGPSIALVRGNNIICGVIYNPITRECFTAARGEGAWLNDKPIHVSDIDKTEKALMSFSFPTQITENSSDLRDFIKLISRCQAIRRSGSTALNLAYIASGRFDGQTNHTAHAWDVAAGFLLVQEAGGIVTRPNGEPFDLLHASFLAASTKELHLSLLNIIG